MNSLKHILTLALATFVVVGSLGFSLFEHICNQEGKSVSYFVPLSSHTSNHSEHEHAEEDDSCCHETKNDGVNNNCCNDEVKVFKANFDYYQSIQHVALVSFTGNSSCLNKFVFTEKSITRKPFYRPPPPLTQRKTRAISQMYLI